ncbi:MAG: hypothetical protein HYW70_02650 [Candidatus Nealsonbacteria bacterium]|nr:hypothetical protein [Candidatus Nealsonbacteria bacterium]
MSLIKNILKIFIMIVLGLASFSVTFIHTSLLLTLFLPGYPQESILIAVSIFAMFVVPVAAVNQKELVSLSALLYIGASLGARWAGSVPFWTVIVLLVGVSFFDIIMVFKGYLSSFRNAPYRGTDNGKDKAANPLKGLMLDFGGVSMGLGDIFFYSMTVVFSILHFGFFSALFASAGILIGSAITLALISRQNGKALPGLPIPIFMSLGLLFFSTIL